MPSETIETEEFAAAVRDLLAGPPPPADWIGPMEEDLGEVPPSRFADRLRKGHAALGKPPESER